MRLLGTSAKTVCGHHAARTYRFGGTARLSAGRQRLQRPVVRIGKENRDAVSRKMTAGAPWSKGAEVSSLFLVRT